MDVLTGYEKIKGLTMEFKDLYKINGILYVYKYNNGVYAVLEDILTGYEEFIRMEELEQYEYKNIL